jgi:uncharacterized protein (DUF736 family)
MSFTGEIEKLDDGNFAGFVASLSADVSITLSENPYRKSDKHPDLQVTAKSPKGRLIRVGSGWFATSKAGNEFISLALNLGGQTLRANAIRRPEEGDAEIYEIVPWTTEAEAEELVA